MKLLNRDDVYYYFNAESHNIKFNTADGSFYLQVDGYYLSYKEGDTEVRYTEQMAFSPKPIYRTAVDASEMEKYISETKAKVKDVVVHAPEEAGKSVIETNIFTVILNWIKSLFVIKLH